MEENKEQAVVYESEVDLDNLGAVEMLAISYDHPEEGVFVVEGPKMEKVLGYTNLGAEKGFLVFQRFMVEQGIIRSWHHQRIKEDGLERRGYHQNLFPRI